METALTKSEQLNTTFIHESQLCIYFLDPATKKVKYANPAFCDLLGFDIHKIHEISEHDFSYQEPATKDFCAEEMTKTIKIVNDEVRWKKKNGEITVMLCNSLRLKYNNENVVYVAAQDITARVKIEEDLKELNNEMETFIYKTSHDLRGPLASIMGIVNVAKLESQDPALPLLEMINNSAEKLDSTLTNLVKAMKIKNFNRFSDKIDFRALVNDILQKFEYYKGFNRMNVEVKVDQTRYFYSNRQAIETIFQNFIENAIKYQNYSVAYPFLRIIVTIEDRNIRISFEDNGIGIQVSDQKKVFDMYYRATNFSSGSGLGLYLAKKGAELLKANILLESVPGIGTTFTLIIPLDSRRISEGTEMADIPADNLRYKMPDNSNKTI